jgi:hypothetical protein
MHGQPWREYEFGLATPKLTTSAGGLADGPFNSSAAYCRGKSLAFVSVLVKLVAGLTAVERAALARMLQPGEGGSAN